MAKARANTAPTLPTNPRKQPVMASDLTPSPVDPLARDADGRLDRLAAAFRLQPELMPNPLAALLNGSAPPVENASGSGLLDAHGNAFLDGRHLVEPDIATCPHCLGDLFDPQDRRYGYPFTNCNQCGPRFAIMQSQPYDRAHTSMGEFAMCVECASQYLDPRSRWYHAQPLACPECGPRVWFVDNAAMAGENLTYAQDEKWPAGAPHRQPVDINPEIGAAVEMLKQGGILGLKGMGGFHLLCAATHSQAVMRLRRNKGQLFRPLTVMVRSSAEAAYYCHLSPTEEKLLTGPQAPIVLLRKRADAPTVPTAAPLAPEIAPACTELGMTLPQTGLGHILIQSVGLPLVMVSANRPGAPICANNSLAWQNLREMCDGFLFHNLSIVHPSERSVFFVWEEPGDHAVRASAHGQRARSPLALPGVQILRRSRGLAPRPVVLPKGLFLEQPILAVGADRRSVAALAVDHQVFLTPHLGELTDPSTRHLHRHTLSELAWLFQIRPEMTVCDLHPQAISSLLAQEWAESQAKPLLRVQHHHAHIAACLADNQQSGPAIGLCFDDLGYGPDGSFWGGEVLWADLTTYQRRYHLEPVHLPGGEYTDAPPCQVAVAYLRALVPALPPEHIPDLLPSVTAAEVEMVDGMRLRGQNVARTTSMGRLCHAVGSILGLCHNLDSSRVVQAIQGLSHLAAQANWGPIYPIKLEKGQIRLSPFISALVSDRIAAVPAPQIALGFFRTLAALALAAAEAVRQEIRDEQGPAAPGSATVALAGEVWQSRLLLELTVPQLRAAGFTVLLPRAVPGTDAGIAYGQVVITAAQLAASR